MKMIKLKKVYETVDTAEEAFGIDYFDDKEDDDHMQDTDLLTREQILNSLSKNLGRLSKKQRIQLATKIFMFIAENDFEEQLKYFIPRDFIEICLSAMKHLQNNCKDNVVADLCRSLGMRKDGSATRLDVDKMPFGLIAYNCKFFAIDDASNLHASQDYMKWMETMYSYFGNTWASLHLGPMWSYTDFQDEKEESKERDIVGEALAMALKEKMVLPDLPTPLPIEAVVSKTPEGPLPLVPTLHVDLRSPEQIPSLESHPACHQHRSTLWSSLSPSEREEIDEAETNPEDIGAMFGLQVQAKKTTSLKRNTMEVSLNC